MAMFVPFILLQNLTTAKQSFVHTTNSKLNKCIEIFELGCLRGMAKTLNLSSLEGETMAVLQITISTHSIQFRCPITFLFTFTF